jgi:anti-sigma regulatory factor (Ser/Thr protein kinase)
MVSARAVSVAIRNFLAEQGVPEKELFSYELCIAEASNNAVEYARGPSRNLKPFAEALFTPSQIELRVTDHTEGFVLPEKIPPPSPLTDRGRGLFLIQSVMDEVRYLRGTKENILVMRKKRSFVRPAAASNGEGAAGLLSLGTCKRLLAEATEQMSMMEDQLLLRSRKPFPRSSAAVPNSGASTRSQRVSEGGSSSTFCTSHPRTGMSCACSHPTAGNCWSRRLRSPIWSPDP